MLGMAGEVKCDHSFANYCSDCDRFLSALSASLRIGAYFEVEWLQIE